MVNWFRLSVVGFFVLLLSISVVGCKIPGFLTGKTEKQKLNEGGITQAITVKILTDGEKRKLSRSFFFEIHKQIFLEPPKSRKMILEWVNVLDQGASIEGVYRGLINSRKYRDLENGKAPLAAVRFFAKEMALVEQKKNLIDLDAEKRSKEIIQKVISFPIFTLKRELGDLVLGRLNGIKTQKERAKWYGLISARWAREGVDFGLKQRNNTDAKFHEYWALQNSLGIIQWELLNKAHRMINYYGDLKVKTK